MYVSHLSSLFSAVYAGVGSGPEDKGLSGKTGEIPLQTNPAYQSPEEMKTFPSNDERITSDPQVI